MASIPTLASRLRLELGDPGFPFQAEVVADGSTARFSLPVELIADAGLRVEADGVEMGEEDYSLDHRSGVLVTTPTLDQGTLITVSGTYYESFVPADLETFVETALLQHLNGRKTEIGLPMGAADLPGVEEYLVVILAQIEALWAMLTDAAQEIDVRSPDGITIPVGQRYQQIMGLIAGLQMRYDELARALNVGLHRIEMITLRRTSRTTGRLVPVYESMEYDQISKGFMPDYGPPGTLVSVKGDRFTGATGVALGGVAAETFTVVSDSQITFEVPEGAPTGYITVTTPGGTITSHYQFRVGHGLPQIHMGAKAQRVYPPIDDGIV